MASSILHMPPEVLGAICNFLDGRFVLDLLDAHVLLAKRLLRPGGLQYFDMRSRMEHLAIDWTPQRLRFGLFPGLVSLRLEFPDSSLLISHLDLPYLPKTMQFLYLQYRRALEAWHTDKTLDRPVVSSLRLSEMMPSLQSLTLLGSNWKSQVGRDNERWTDEMHTSWFAHLPRTLRHLHLSHYPSSGSDLIQHLGHLETLIGTSVDYLQTDILPRSLTFYEPSFLAVRTPDQLLQLPESITHLRVILPDDSTIRSRATTRNLSPQWIAALPIRLKSIIIANNYQQLLKPEEIQALPATLTAIHLQGPPSLSADCLGFLPRGLRIFTAERVSFFNLTKEKCELLPPKLERLEFLKTNCYLRIEDLIHLPRSLTNLTVDIDIVSNSPMSFAGLPPQLSSFSFSCTGSAQTAATIFKMLPSSITHLNLTRLDGMDDASLKYWPEKLRFFKSDLSSLSDACFALLPSTLVEFKIPSIELSGMYPGSEMEITQASLKKSFAKMWYARFPTCMCPKTQVRLSNQLPKECQSLNLQTPHAVPFGIFDKCERITVIDVSKISLTTPHDNDKVCTSEVDARVAMEQPSFQLPASLVVLRIRTGSPLTTQMVAWLPRGLRILDCPNNEDVSPQADFPPKLDFLCLGSVWTVSIYGPPKENRLPAGLKELALKELDLEYLKSIPRNISTLRAAFKNCDSLCILSALPPLLACFDMNRFQTLSIDSSSKDQTQERTTEVGFPLHLISHLPPTLERLICKISKVEKLKELCGRLPKGIETVHIPDTLVEWALKTVPQLCFSTTFVCDFSFEEELVHLPKSITTLTLSQSMVKDTEGLNVTWPPELKRLTIHSYIPGSGYLSSLPQSITDLTIKCSNSREQSTTDNIAISERDIRGLPSGLQRLYIQFPSYNSLTVDDAWTSALPRESLHMLRLEYVEISPSYAFSGLPHSLVELHLPNVEEDDLPHLPPNLTIFSVINPSYEVRKFIAALDFRDVF